MADKPYDLLGTESNYEDTSADPSMGDITYSAHRQQNDLLGLTLQMPNTCLSNNETKISNASLQNASLQAASDEKIAACPVHNALHAKLHADTLTGNGTTSEPNRVLMPMKRYVAEGVEERYALFDVGQAESGGDWARYFGCLCGK
jgi:hypothetical protein